MAWATAAKKRENFSISKRKIACLLPWPKIPLTYIEDDATRQNLKSYQSAPL